MLPYKYFTAILLLLLLFFTPAAANIINTLPGYPDTLPFHLETGYIGVGEDEQVQLFYYFVESERDPDKDPIVLWLTGGPGCSGFSGLVYEIGPLRFDIQSFDGSLPPLILNPYSWTKVANIIFIDSPVGTGFSYATTSEGFNSSDTKSTLDNYTFLKKWLSNHPRFVKNRLYIGGDSYGGKTVTLLALEIANGNEGGLEQRMNLKGYFIGNPWADKELDSNERIPYANRMGLISDEYFELAKSSCNGNYIDEDPSNAQCRYALELCDECTKNIKRSHILDPNCNLFSPKHDRILEDDPDDFLFMFKEEEQWCRNNNYVESVVWANDQTVQEALYIRNGTIREWKRCNRSLPGYEHDVDSVIRYHQILNQKGFGSLVYSGDHDMLVPYIATLKWIHSLNLTVKDKWRPWTVDGQVAGYTEKHKGEEAYITFVTVKGAGHTAPEYMPKQCLAMIKRWLSLFPL
ncbi:serine carboxypeptidase-like 13 isoform X1 [Henckelia pumila]|uniref:serine carboxypeptidase-like 13 isoform X1 n=1 Tax=Henckelia pumila TaxID=405737 RepID=UPI003C6E66CE